MDGRIFALAASLTVHATVLVATGTPHVGEGPGVRSNLSAETDIPIDVLDLPADPIPPDAARDGAPTFPDAKRAAARPSRPASPAPRSAPTVQAPRATAAPDAAPGASPPVDDAPRFTIAIGAAVAPSAAAAPSFVAALGGGAAAGGVDDAPLSEDGVSAPARLSRGDAPRYPESARRQGVEADVPLEIVVSSAGVVEEARALSIPGYGLDAAAIEAVKRYRFRPAVRDGLAVRVRMRWVMQFRLW